MTLSLDTETTGIDLFHGAKPFAVTTCDEAGNQRWWEWHVNPLTREPEVPPEDLREIDNLLKVAAGWQSFSPDVAGRHALVLQNAKFDAAALATLGLADFPWPAVRDTLLLGHLLESNRPHNLTALAMRHCGIDLKPFEAALGEAVLGARRLVQRAQLRRKRRLEGKAAKKPPRRKKVPKEREVRFTAEGGIVTDDLFAPPEEVEVEVAAGPFPLNDSDDELADWRIADSADPSMPSATEQTWRFDYWLPRAFARWKGLPAPADGCEHEWGGRGLADGRCELCGGHFWWLACRDYFNADSYATAALWPVMRGEMERRGLGRLYSFSLKRLPILVAMERRGLSVSARRHDRLEAECRAESDRLRQSMRAVARSRLYDLELPRGSTPNNSLLGFVFGKNPVTGEPPRPGIREEHPGCLRLPWAVRTEAGAPSLDSKSAIPYYLDTLPRDGKAYKFVRDLRDSREWDTALTYLASYRRFRLPLSEWGGGEWFLLHPTINPTGTDTLRHSSERPNSQNCSKRKKSNQRRIFGPTPGREWWCLDYSNLELRLPAYESGEQDLIRLFERPDEPPFYGSEHLLNFAVIYPDLWEEAVRNVGSVEKAADWIKGPDGWKDTWYQWCKNGDFAVQYGAIDKASGDGTADRAFHRPGSQARLRARFAKKESLNRKWIQYANKFGYVETMPDRAVDPARGYPLLVTRTESGRVLETVPLSYHVQGTACWVKISAMIKCAAQLEEWWREGFHAHLNNDVHDELDFDFPSGGRKNLWRVLRLKELMESCGDDVGVPLVVEYAWHPVTWGEAEKLPDEERTA